VIFYEEVVLVSNLARPHDPLFSTLQKCKVRSELPRRRSPRKFNQELRKSGTQEVSRHMLLMQFEFWNICLFADFPLSENDHDSPMI
jgi:hypothetical protein